MCLSLQLKMACSTQEEAIDAQVSVVNPAVSLCVLCGLPASGKTTFSKNLQTVCDPSQIVIIFEYDKILPDHKDIHIQNHSEHHQHVENETEAGELTGNKSWKFYRQQIVTVIEMIIQAIQRNQRLEFPAWLLQEKLDATIKENCKSIFETLSAKWPSADSKVIVIIDDNMYFRSMRYEYFKLAKKYSTGFCQLICSISTCQAIQRNKARGQNQQVPEDVIVAMAQKLELPDDKNHPWECQSLVLEMEKCQEAVPQAVLNLIERSFLNPVQPQLRQDEEESSKSRVQCSASMLHQGDLILRKCVATWMAQGKKFKPPVNMKCRAESAHKAKEYVLLRLKEDPFSLGVSTEWTIENPSSDPSTEFYKVVAEAFMKKANKL